MYWHRREAFQGSFFAWALGRNFCQALGFLISYEQCITFDQRGNKEWPTNLKVWFLHLEVHENLPGNHGFWSLFVQVQGFFQKNSPA